MTYWNFNYQMSTPFFLISYNLACGNYLPSSHATTYQLWRWQLFTLDPCGGGLEYLHRSPASRKRRQKGNPVPGGITGPPCSWGL
jgi:hypothetical protein